MLNVTHLTKEVSASGATVKAVNDVNFQIASGTMAAIVGKSGSGKSTLLALLGALDVPTAGTIEVDGQEVTKLRGQALLKYRRATIGFVFQSYNLIPNLSALDNVMLPMEFNGQSSSSRLSRAKKLLEQVGLSGDKLKRVPTKLSGGEQQRVAIARALANTPKIILADEPTGNLESQTGKMIIELLQSLAKSENATILTVTHDPAIAQQASFLFHMTDGRLRQGRD
jgi:putative ABC transport system ATP-binding protein